MYFSHTLQATVNLHCAANLCHANPHSFCRLSFKARRRAKRRN